MKSIDQFLFPVICTENLFYVNVQTYAKVDNCVMTPVIYDYHQLMVPLALNSWLVNSNFPAISGCDTWSVSSNFGFAF